MAGKLIAVAIMKGGVGKTTTVVSLAEALAADNPNASILVVDLDPQASASVCLAGNDLLAEMIAKDKTLEAFLDLRLIARVSAKLAPRIRPAVSRTTQGGNQLKISLLPCGPDLRVVEREIIYSLNARRFNMRGIEGQTWKLFEQEFQPLGKTYDYVIFDCPPGISPLSEVAIRASDLVIVPTIPDFISVYGINGLLRVFWGATRGELPPPKLKPHVLVTMFQRSFKQHKLKVEELERAANTKDSRILLLKTKVQHAAALAGAMRNIDEAPTLNQKTFIQKYGGDVTEVLYQLVQASFMPSDIDGIAVLRAIALAPKLFPDAAAEINNFARKYVAGQLKPATMSLERLTDIYRAINGEALALILDGQADSASAALLKKLDKENPELKAASPGWCRKRLAELASGASEPARKPLVAPKREPKGKWPALTQEEKELAAALKKTINLEKARGLWRETGEASFTLVLAGLTEKQTLGLAKRLDKDNPDLISARLDQLRQRVADLARGTAEPVFKNILEYSSMKVTRNMSRNTK